MKVPIVVDVSMLPPDVSAAQFLKMMNKVPANNRLEIEITQADVDYVLANQPKRKLTPKQEIAQLKEQLEIKEETLMKARFEILSLTDERVDLIRQKGINEFNYENLKKSRDSEREKVREARQERDLANTEAKELDGYFRRIDGYRLIGAIDTANKFKGQNYELKQKLSWMTGLVHDAADELVKDRVFKNLIRNSWSKKIRSVLNHKFK